MRSPLAWAALVSSFPFLLGLDRSLDSDPARAFDPPARLFCPPPWSPALLGPSLASPWPLLGLSLASPWSFSVFFPPPVSGSPSFRPRGGFDLPRFARFSIRRLRVLRPLDPSSARDFAPAQITGAFKAFSAHPRCASSYIGTNGGEKTKRRAPHGGGAPRGRVGRAGPASRIAGRKGGGRFCGRTRAAKGAQL